MKISWHSKDINLPSSTFTPGFKVYETHSLYDIAKVIEKRVWSGSVFKDGYREQKRFISADFISLDFDNGEMSVADAIRAFCDCQHVIGITRNHQKVKKDAPACDRFRVVMPLEHTITSVELYRYTLGLMINKYPVDPAPKDGARYFFPCTEILSIQTDGFLHEVPKELPAKKVYRKRTVNTPSRWVEMQLEHVMPIHTRNTTCWRIFKDLLRCNFGDEEILNLIINSATYGGNVSRELMDEFLEILRNAHKSIADEDVHGTEQNETETQG